MTRQDWIDKYSPWLIGLALRGLVLQTDEKAKGPFDAGQLALKLADKVPRMLEQMWADSQPVPNTAINGKKEPTHGQKAL